MSQLAAIGATATWAAMTHDDVFRRLRVSATAFLTGTGAAALSIATGKIKSTGAIPPEMLEPEPILQVLSELGVEVHREERSIND